MAQTAFSIDNVTSSVTKVEGNAGIFYANLSVSFQIFNRGPNHIAGLYVTTNSWATWQIVPATFQYFGGQGDNVEFWGATFQNPEAGLGVTFEFVVFCDDFGGDNMVPRIWNTNAGSVFQATL